jgi:hypothetical protein
MNPIPIILGVVALLLACVNQRRLWRATTGWRYRRPEAVEPSDAAMTLSRVGLVLVAVFLIVVPILVTASNNHDKKAAAHAAAATSLAEADGEARVQQEATAQRADLVREGTAVLTAIVRHTPPGTSPRSVPLSNLPQWFPELSNARYEVTFGASYATTGQLTFDCQGRLKTGSGSGPLWLIEVGPLDGGWSSIVYCAGGAMIIALRCSGGVEDALS